MFTSASAPTVLAASTRFWDQTARKYAAGAIGDMPGYERTLRRVRACLRPTDRVLEVGCGTATTALQLATATAHYTATDLSPAMVAIAQQKLALAATEVQRVLRVVVADADVGVPVPPEPAHRPAATPVADDQTGGWDAVLAFNLLHLVPDLDHTLAQVAQQLRPGGLFISKTACIAHMNPLVPRVALPVMRLLRLAPPVHVLTQERLLSAMERCGLAIEGVELHATPSRGRDWRPFVLARKPLV